MKIESFTFSGTPDFSQFPASEWNFNKTMILIFGAPEYRNNPKALNSIAIAYPKAKVLGCSTSGEILNSSIYDESITGVFVKFEKTKLKAAGAIISSGDESFEAGQSIGKELLTDDLKAVLILSDGLNVNGSKLVDGLNDVLPSGVGVSGGLAGDSDRFEETWVLKDGVPATNYVSAIGFYGDAIRFGHGSRGGWDIFGPDRVITKSDKNILYELDGKPALELYKNYLGDLAQELPASALLFPLSLKEVNDEKRVGRTILKIDEETQSMTFAGDLPEGASVQLMRANLDRIIEGAAVAAVSARQTRNADDNPASMLSIAISCVGRRLILGERAEEELEAAIESLPDNVTQVGFYSYGEISPYAKGYCDLHNQTMTLTTISEV